MESGNIFATHFNNIANIYKNILEKKSRKIKLNRFNLYVFSYTRELFNTETQFSVYHIIQLLPKTEIITNFIFYNQTTQTKTIKQN
jgi:hypothetical protein